MRKLKSNMKLRVAILFPALLASMLAVSCSPGADGQITDHPEAAQRAEATEAPAAEGAQPTDPTIESQTTEAPAATVPPPGTQTESHPLLMFPEMIALENLMADTGVGVRPQLEWQVVAYDGSGVPIAVGGPWPIAP